MQVAEAAETSSASAPTEPAFVAFSGYGSIKNRLTFTRRFFALSKSKLTYYKEKNMKTELGNFPLVKVETVSDSSKGKKPLATLTFKKGWSSPVIILFADAEAHKKFLSSVSQAVKAIQIESPIGSPVSSPRQAIYSPRGPASPRSNQGAAPPFHEMSKDAASKFCAELHKLIGARDVAGVRALLDSRPHRRALLSYTSSKELSRTLLHLAVDVGEIHIFEIILAEEPLLLAHTDALGLTPLHIAANAGRMDIVTRLLQAGANPSAVDHSNRSPAYLALIGGHPKCALAIAEKAGWPSLCLKALSGVLQHLTDALSEEGVLPFVKAPECGLSLLHLAAASGSAESTLHLLGDHQLEVDERDLLGKTALHLASSCGAAASVTVLLAKGANLTLADNRGRVALHVAASTGHADVVKMLLDKGAKFTVEDESGFCPLHVASYRRHVDTMKVLLMKGAPPDVRGAQKLTPLMLCTQDSAVAAATTLLAGKANPSLKAENGKSALYMAIENRALDIVTLLIEQGADVNSREEEFIDTLYPIHAAIDWPDALRVLLDAGSDPTKDAPDGTTILNRIAAKGDLPLVKRLVECGADVDMSDKARRTALHHAALHGHVEVIKFLLSKGVHCECRDRDGRTALSLACLAGGDEDAEGGAAAALALLEAGADPDTMDTKKLQPMHLAAKFGKEACLRLLLAKDVQVSENASADNPLHLAIVGEALPCVLMLIEDNVCDLEALNSDGRTALHLALRVKEEEIVDALLINGASFTVRDPQRVTPFHLAARMGKRRLLELMSECDIGWEDHSQRNPLHYASAGGALEAIQFLLSAAGDSVRQYVNSTDKVGNGPCHFAAEGNHDACVHHLASSGADFTLHNVKGLTPFHTAAKKGCETLDFMLAHKPRDFNVDDVDVDGISPLMVAALHGNHLGAATLIKHGASTELVSKDNMTMLLAAAEAEHPETISLLLSHGCEPNTTGQAGRAPLHLVSQSGSAESVEVLLRDNRTNVNIVCELDGMTPLHYAASKGHNSAVAALLAHKDIQVNLINGAGATALHCASHAGHWGCVELLISAPAVNMNPIDEKGRTLLHNAVMNNNIDYARVFLEAGNEVNAATKQLATPLHEACVRGSLKCAQFLIENGAHINVKAGQGLTPLHNAASFAKDDIVELLCSKGADLNVLSEKRLTPLHCAASMSHPSTIILLVKNGAEVDIPDVFGETALMKAANAGSLSSVTALIERGAEVNAENAQGDRAYEKAKKKGFGRVCAILYENS